MKKLLALTMSLSLTAGLLAACGSSGDSAAPAEEAQTQQSTESAPETAAEAADGEQVTLRFSWWGGEERLAATLDVISQFEELYPNITIEPEYGSSDGYADKLATQLAGGTAPDIIQIDPGLMPALVSDETNYFVDLLETDFDFSNFDENYYKLRING